ncbi:MAG: ATP-binding protein [Candidatus Methanomethylicaceae archaeon]
MNIEILSHLINFFIFLSKNTLYHILLFIPIIALIFLLPEEKAIGALHPRAYAYLWIFRFIFCLIPLSLSSSIKYLTYLKIPNEILNLLDFKFWIIQLFLDIIGAYICHIRERHNIENIFAINFMIILPYLFSPILLIYSLYERKTKKIKVKEKSEKAIYLGEIKYGLARIPSIQYDRYDDTKITSNEWTPLKTKGELYYDFEKNVNPHLIIAGKSGCGKTTTLIRIINELSKFGKIIIIDFHGEYIGLSNLINAEIIDVANQGLNPLTPIANENYYEIANDLINSINIIDIYKLGITQESELMDSIVSIKEKNLEELYNEIDKRAKDEKAGHIRDALIGLKNRIRILQTGFSIKTNIDFQKIINKNSIIDLSGISNEDVKTIIAELILRKILRCMIFNKINERTFLIIDEAHRISKKEGIINTIMRESRKYNLACILSSQLIYDFDQSIIGNAGMKLFMMNDSERDIDAIINITGCEILRQVLPSLKQFEAVIIRKQEIEELMKTTRGRLYPTITLLIASLKPYFKEEKLKDIKIRKTEEVKVREEKKKEIDFLKIKEEIIKDKILSFDKMEKLKIEDLEILNKGAVNNFKNISIEEKNRLKELGLIKTIGESIILTHSGREILKIVRKY